MSGLSLFQRLATPADGAVGPQPWVDPWGLYRWMVRPTGGGEALGSETAKLLERVRRRVEAKIRGRKVEPREGDKPGEAEARLRAAVLAEELSQVGAVLEGMEAPRPELVAQMVVAGLTEPATEEPIECSRADIVDALSSDVVIEAGHPHSGALLGVTLCRLLCDESIRLAHELGLVKEPILGNSAGSSDSRSEPGSGRAVSNPMKRPSSSGKKGSGGPRAKRSDSGRRRKSST